MVPFAFSSALTPTSYLLPLLLMYLLKPSVIWKVYLLTLEIEPIINKWKYIIFIIIIIIIDLKLSYQVCKKVLNDCTEFCFFSIVTTPDHALLSYSLNDKISLVTCMSK